MKKKRRKMKKGTMILISVLIGLLLMVFLFAGYKLYTIAHEYYVAQHSYSKLNDQFVSASTPAPQGSQPTQGDPQTGTSQPGSAQTDPAALADPSPISVDFDALLAVNPDVKGWLYSEGTKINYPVVQAADNDYYLHRLYDRSNNASGSLFIDFRSDGSFLSRSAIIYGHHMNDGSMFASLVNYRKQDYYDAHPVMYLNTPIGNYLVEIFSGFITAADSSVYVTNFPDDETYSAYLIKMKAFSDFECDVTPTVDDRIIVLSTCTYEYNQARYVVFGRLVPTSDAVG